MNEGRLRPRIITAVVVLGLVALVGVAIAAEHNRGEPIDRMPTSIESQMTLVTGAVRVSDLRPADGAEAEGATEYAATVDEVLFWASDLGLDPLAEGPFRVRVNQEVFGTEVLVGGRGVLLMSYSTTAEVLWNVVIAATEDETGLNFVGAHASEHDYDGVLSGVVTRSSIPGVATDLDFLVGWAEERQEDRAAGDPSDGPFTDAFVNGQNQAAREEQDAAWYVAPVHWRSLDPDDVPAEITNQLVGTAVYVVVRADARREDGHVVLRTATGVSYVAALSLGSHRSTVHALPGETWEAVITDDVEAPGTVVGTVVPSVWTGWPAVVIRIACGSAAKALSSDAARLSPLPEIGRAYTQPEFSEFLSVNP